MIVCDRCSKPARPFGYGDMVNQTFQVMDLCADCAETIFDLLRHYQDGVSLVVANVADQEVSHD